MLYLHDMGDWVFALIRRIETIVGHCPGHHNVIINSLSDLQKETFSKASKRSLKDPEEQQISLLNVRKRFLILRKEPCNFHFENFWFRKLGLNINQYPQIAKYATKRTRLRDMQFKVIYIYYIYNCI